MAMKVPTMPQRTFLSQKLYEIMAASVVFMCNYSQQSGHLWFSIEPRMARQLLHSWITSTNNQGKTSFFDYSYEKVYSLNIERILHFISNFILHFYSKIPTNNEL